MDRAKDMNEVDRLMEMVDRCAGQYNEARSSIMMILQLYSFSIGGSRELSQLICLLNFNYVYPQFEAV